MRDPVYLNVRRIDRARLTRGWTRTAMAGAAKLSQETRTKISRGGPVSIRTAKKLARTLGLPLADVLILPGNEASGREHRSTPGGQCADVSRGAETPNNALAG